MTIDVGEKTTVEGALINSETGELSLSTNELEVRDLGDSEVYSNRGGSVGIGSGGLASLGVDITESERTGITRGTIGEGTIEVRSLTPEETQELLGEINRDVTRFRETLSESEFGVNGELDVEGLRALGEALDAIADQIAELPTGLQDQAIQDAADKFGLGVIDFENIDEIDALAEANEDLAEGILNDNELADQEEGVEVAGLGSLIVRGGQLIYRVGNATYRGGRAVSRFISDRLAKRAAEKALQQFGRNIDDLTGAANQTINKEGLTAAGRALSKHATSQRASGTFPKLTGNIANQNRIAREVVETILKDPKSKFKNLSRGGLEVRGPSGQGVRFNSDGKLSGFLD